MRTWSGSATWTPARLEHPHDAGQVADVVRQAAQHGERVKALGAGHSFSAIAATDGAQLVLDRMSGLVGVDAATGRARLRAGTPLHQVGPLLGAHGRALASMGDIDRQSVGGAISTGTHGAGLGFTGYSGMITGLELVTADGAVRWLSGAANVASEERALFEAARVGLGALGVVTEVEIETVPAFLLRADEAAEELDAVVESFLERARTRDHYEFFWFPGSRSALTKTNTRLPLGAEYAPLPRLRSRVMDGMVANGVFAAMCRVGARVPRTCESLARLAGWGVDKRSYTDVSYRVFVTNRDVRFREMEYALPLNAFGAAFDGIREIVRDLSRAGRGVTFPVEVRAAAGDDVWLSSASGRDSVYIAVHKYHREDPSEYFGLVERLLVGLGGRPHWGKMHTRDASWTAQAYPRFADWAAARDAVDPDRVFTNRYVERVVGA